MANIIRMGRTLVAHINGKMFSKEFPMDTDLVALYEKFLNSTDDELLNAFAAPKSTEEIRIEKENQEIIEKAKANKDIIDFMRDVSDNGHDIFVVKENSIYLKGINISMPELLVRAIATSDNEEHVLSLIKFWSLCAMNPDPRARHDLFTFLAQGDFTITPSGYFVAYRNAQIKEEGDNELMTAVTRKYVQCKLQNKNPAKYLVLRNKYDNSIDFQKAKKKVSSEYDVEGFVDEVYGQISSISETTYTDAHTRTMTIKLGEPVTQDRKECDADPNADCSRGLHVGNKAFMKKGSFGNVGFVCLVNPKNVVAVPHYNENKMRCCEYLPMAIAEYDENGNLITIDTNVFEDGLVENTQEELELMANMSTTELEEYKKNEFIALEIDIESLSNMQDIASLTQDEANQIVLNRMING